MKAVESMIGRSTGRSDSEEEARLFFKNGELQEQSREYTNA
jgi:hypothetical protein